MMKHMTNRERILNALAGKPTDRLPWSPLIDPYFISSLPAQGYNMDIIEAMRFIGCDIMERHVCSAIPHINNVNIRYTEDGKTRRKIYETPVGTIYEESGKTDSTVFVTKHFAETVDDIKVLQYVAENTTYTSNARAFKERDNFIGDSGIATVSLTPTPIQEMLQYLAGVENTVYLMMDYPEETDALLWALHERNKRECLALCDYDTPAIFEYEDTSTTVLNKNMLCNYELPCVNDYKKIFSQNGKQLITHMCGKLAGFKDEIASADMDGIDSVCPPTTGDLAIWEARRAFGNKILIGGIEPPSLAMSNVRKTLENVAEIIEKTTDKTGFILSTGDAVPHSTPIENMIAITKYIENMGADSLGTQPDRELISYIENDLRKKKL